jgi:hypothetical protein
MTEARKSLYRCVERGDGNRLNTISLGLIGGPLAADRSLACYDWSEDTEVQESSIRCTVHGDWVRSRSSTGTCATAAGSAAITA